MADPIFKLLSLTKLQARLPIVNDDKTGTTALVDLLNRTFKNIERSFNGVSDVVQQLVDLAEAQGATITRVRSLEEQQAQASKDARLVNSYTDPTAVMTSAVATDPTMANITIANHYRVYADGVKVAVTGGSINGLALNTTYYVFYDDPNQTGGDVVYKYSTNNTDAAQTNGRHSLNYINTPQTATSPPEDGGGVNPPGTSPRTKNPRNTDVDIE